MKIKLIDTLTEILDSLFQSSDIWNTLFSPKNSKLLLSILRVEEGQNGKSWWQSQKFGITLLNLLMIRVQKKGRCNYCSKEYFVMERKKYCINEISHELIQPKS